VGTTASERLNQAVLDALPAHIAVIGPDGWIVATNRTWDQFNRTTRRAIRPARRRAGAAGSAATTSTPVGPRGADADLLDLNMPRMGGIEFLRELRADPDLKHITVVVLTTSDEERDKIEAYNRVR
jgi:CheY-like chemotaxis protein